MSAYGSNGSKCSFLGTISVNRLMYPDENLPLKRVNTPHLDALDSPRGMTGVFILPTAAGDGAF